MRMGLFENGKVMPKDYHHLSHEDYLCGASSIFGQPHVILLFYNMYMHYNIIYILTWTMIFHATFAHQIHGDSP